MQDISNFFVLKNNKGERFSSVDYRGFNPIHIKMLFFGLWLFDREIVESKQVTDNFKIKDCVVETKIYDDKDKKIGKGITRKTIENPGSRVKTKWKPGYFPAANFVKQNSKMAE